MSLRPVHALALALTLGLGAAPAWAKPKKSKKAPKSEPRTLLYDPDRAAGPPDVLTDDPSKIDLPDAPLLLVTMGGGSAPAGKEGVEPEDVTVDEKQIILDKGKTAKPGDKPGKAKKKKKKKAADD